MLETNHTLSTRQRERKRVIGVMRIRFIMIISVNSTASAYCPSNCRLGNMEPLMLQVGVLRLAAGYITGHGHRGIVVVQPLHMFPGPLPPKKIVDPEQRLDN